MIKRSPFLILSLNGMALWGKNFEQIWGKFCAIMPKLEKTATRGEAFSRKIITSGFVMSGLAWPRCSCRARGLPVCRRRSLAPEWRKRWGWTRFPSRCGGRGADDLPGPLAANGEEPVGRPQPPVEGKGLEAVAKGGVYKESKKTLGPEIGPSELVDFTDRSLTVG